MTRLKQAGIALVSSSFLLASNPEMVSAAPDIELGRQVFNGNCAACHAGGQNTVISERTLRADAITQYLDGGFNPEAIKYQVLNNFLFKNINKIILILGTKWKRCYACLEWYLIRR